MIKLIIARTIILLFVLAIFSSLLGILFAQYGAGGLVVLFTLLSGMGILFWAITVIIDES